MSAVEAHHARDMLEAGSSTRRAFSLRALKQSYGMAPLPADEAKSCQERDREKRQSSSGSVEELSRRSAETQRENDRGGQNKDGDPALFDYQVADGMFPRSLRVEAPFLASTLTSTR